MTNSTRIKRVLMTTDTVGGVWNFTLELAASLSKRGIEVALAGLGALPSETQRREAAAISGLWLHPSAYKLEWMEKPWTDLENATHWLLDLEREYTPDVVHLNSFGIATSRWRSPVVLTAHSCVSSWWAAVKQEPLPSTWTRYVKRVNAALAQADKVIAPSAWMLDELGKYYSSFKKSCAEVVPNGRSGKHFKPAHKKLFVLGAGRLWDEAKGERTLAEAAADLSWPVYLAGDSCGPSGEPASFPGCGMLGQLTAEEIASCYGQAAVFAHPACYEPFGLSVLEAALSGCALVLGDIPSLRENWSSAAEFVPPYDSAALAAKLQQLISNPSLREEMAHNSLARARLLTPERMAARYLSAYDSVLKESYACAS